VKAVTLISLPVIVLKIVTTVEVMLLLKPVMEAQPILILVVQVELFQSEPVMVVTQ
jgi:hypothetical protein